MITFCMFFDVQNLVKIRRALPRIGEIQRLRDFLCFSFPFLPFLFFLPSSTGKTIDLILTHDGSHDAVLRKEVPFGNYKI